MPVYKTGDIVNFPLNLKVLKTFAHEDDVYYIVEILQNDVPWKKVNKMYGTLDFNGNPNVPDIVRQKADTIINILKNRDSE
jgi:hypothetical protein